MDAVCTEMLGSAGGERVLELEELGRFGSSGARLYRATAWMHGSIRSMPFVVKVSPIEHIQRDFAATQNVVAYFEDARVSRLVTDELCPRAAIVTPLLGMRHGETKVEELGDLVFDMTLADELLSELLVQVYEACAVAHGRQQDQLPRRDVRLQVEYEWYLRGRATDELLTRCFGTELLEVEILGARFEHPVRFVDRLLASDAELMCAATHGDLHPSNVIVRGRADGRPEVHLIDFGWGRHEAHILKDFALMEWSLRFLRFPPFFDLDVQREVDEMLVQEEGWRGLVEGSGGIASSGLATEYRRLGRLIGVVRTTARSTCEGSGYNYSEYQVALYLILYGLLKHPTYPFHAALRALGLLQNGLGT
jgi:hypothetical protein